MNIGDNTIMKKQSNIIKGLAVVFAAALLITACKKQDPGAYDFENKVNVYEGNVYAYFKSQPGVYDSLVKVIDRMDWLKEALSSNTQFTVFAPTNRSFVLALQNLNNLRTSQHKPALNLSTANLDELDVLTCRYVIEGKYSTDSLLLADGVLLNTIKYDYIMHGEQKSTNAYGFVNGGPKSIIYSDIKYSQYIAEWQRTTTQAVNIYTDNAIVHALSPSHEFGFSEFTLRLNK
ncbi:fasciclin domain-containing protein [Pedobacter frigoris]|uniref:FAS1 domain-containing protein n=1 Tax=Pedobacter frigoris TaxID=2571272 RepID=A0A4U1CFA9_9SPHI|nr:fasciclin domain-containing protein [Pedobacter frigoris]TKC05143.1 hypothetical protein FA047_15395 [Pedobacter frigoris]